MGRFGTKLYDEESEPEESVPGGVDGTQNSSNANKLGTRCFGTFDKRVLANVSVRLTRGWKKPKQGSPEFPNAMGKYFSSGALGVIDFNKIKAATDNFSHENELGRGGFGLVYKGVLPNGTSIAVKQLSGTSWQGIHEFESEIVTLSDLQHPHIVRLLGYCVQHNQRLLVYEYMENNSLQHALFGSEELRMRLNWPTRVKICVGIAKGLAFLHEESQMKIIHRDIKPTNILLDKNLNPKISDFGLATPTDPSHKHYDDRIAGTYGYMAPEYIKHGRLTEKVDVFSFGAVTLQIVSAQKIITDDRTNYLLDRAYTLQREENLVALVDPTLELDYNSRTEATTILNLAMMCINSSKSLRPKMSEVVNILEETNDIRTLKSNLKMGKGILVRSQSTQSAGSTSWEEASDAVSSEEFAETSNLLDDDDGTHSGKNMMKATTPDRDLVPSRWDTVPRIKLAPPTLYAEQESRLQVVRDHPFKEFLTIMFASSCPNVSPRQKMKGSTVDRAMVKALYASRMAFYPPSSKKVKFIAPSASQPRSVDQVASRETGPGDAPTPCPTMTPSHSRASSSTPVGIGAPMQSPTRTRAPHSCPASSSGSISMLQDVNLAKERLCGFVTATEIQEVESRGPEGIIDTAMEGFAMVAAAFPYLFSRMMKLEEAFRDLATERQARGVAEEQLGLEREAREAAEEQLRLAHERAAPLESELLASCKRVSQLEADRVAICMRAETELRASRERATRAEAELRIAQERAVVVEADLQKALERATRAEAHFIEMEKKRDTAERAVADAFIDGYEELKGKISTAFPAYDFSSFLPYEAPETDDEEEIFDESGSGSNE